MLIKKIFVVLTLLASISLAAEESKDSKIVAKVEGKEISVGEIKKRLKDFAEANSMTQMANINFDTLPDEVKGEMIKSLILGDYILKEAENSGVNKTDEYKKALQSAEKQIAQKIFLDQLIKKAASEEKLKAKYDEYVKSMSGKEEYKASHILVKTEEEAKQVKAKLNKGEDFNKLAKELSQDTSNKDNGGSLGYFSQGQMVPEFEKVVFNLKINQISDPFKTDFGYHIVKLEDKRPVTPTPFDEMRSKFNDELANDVIQNYIKDLEKKYKIEILKD